MKDVDETTSQATGLSEWNALVQECQAPAVVSNNNNNARLWIGAGLAGATVLGTLALTAPFVLSKSPLPYMATPGHKIKKALDFVHQNIKRKQLATSSTSSSRTSSTTNSSCASSKSSLFVDLGSGDGEGVYQAAQTGYFDQCVGIELNTTLYMLSSLRRQFFWNANLRKRSTFVRRDLFAYSLQPATVCMIFGVTPLMAPLSRKLAQECQPGTHILAYRFKLPLATHEHDDTTLVKAEMVYDVEEMRVYECK